MDPYPCNDPLQNELNKFAKPNAHNSRLGLIGYSPLAAISLAATIESRNPRMAMTVAVPKVLGK